MTTFKKGEPVLHRPDNDRGVILEGPYPADHGNKAPLDSYTVRFPNGDYVCVGKDLETLKNSPLDLPKKLCLTNGDIIFSDPSMVHIASMYDRPDRIQAAEEIVFRYNRYDELLSALKGARDRVNPIDPLNTEHDPEYTAIREILRKCEDR